ncbi:hypothetical protein AA313_de0209667 [Arthrobotrys entomopaga]|nr:hypothetical protein AA313_de0209667 [Arthrobotrys entomopaga]
MVQIKDVNIIRDVMNRVAGMTGLEVGRMVVRRGGKVATEWMHLYEGDLVYIDYPISKIPVHLKERAAKEAANKSVVSTRRAKAAIPIKPPKDVTTPMLQNDQSIDGLLIDLSSGSPSFQSGSDGFLPSETSFASATSSQHDLKDESVYSGLEQLIQYYSTPSALTTKLPLEPQANLSIPATPTKPIQVTFKFWSGQELSLSVSSESRASSVISVVTSKILRGNLNVRASDLEFVTLDGRDINGFENIGDAFKDGKGDTVVRVLLQETLKDEVDDIAHKIENLVPVDLESSLI